MASDSWSSRLSTTSSRRYHSRSDLYEETEVIIEEDLKAEFLCPFCAEDFDVVGLCCHIDEEHPLEAKNGVCPVCAKRVGMDIVGHITMQHGNFFKVQRRRRLRKGSSNSAFSLLRKELREGSLQSLLGGSSCFVSSSNAEPDPLLSSFIFNPSTPDEPLSVQPLSSVEAVSVQGSTNEESRERNVQQSLLSDKDQEEKSRRCRFVQGLLMSTILDDEL
ncbi:protein DEHYDRATION-INDUCED 19 homolog 4 [Ricinus communis]|uniref:protein DEHYDRATION-INDUCED 19 homolog 4 n=1 Tax=Ricinus communis TaxID=3988 RepID=UPI00077278C0|nr:protein DEHYDRATION-INDUCED 19 homolog 4 [Ricinus communis]|eukprot:XP_015574664.1 protein DEHYDRATION-INDUCED 19 homolog 4 [Ricinus communis]